MRKRYSPSAAAVIVGCSLGGIAAAIIVSSSSYALFAEALASSSAFFSRGGSFCCDRGISFTRHRGRFCLPAISTATKTTTTATAARTTTVLHGRAVKRRKLASNFGGEEAGLASSASPTTTKKKKAKGGAPAPTSSSSAARKKPRTGSGGGTIGGGGGGGISSSLANWAASVGSDGSDSAAVASSASPAAEEASKQWKENDSQEEGDDDDDDDGIATSFSPFSDTVAQNQYEYEAPNEDENDDDDDDDDPGAFSSPRGKKRKKGDKDRRSRQAERKAAESARKSLVSTALSDLRKVFDPSSSKEEGGGGSGKAAKAKQLTFDIASVLDTIRVVVANPPENKGVRVISQGPTLYNYRMVWAGSDDAVCHLCTGLHKVPLARLQEIFMILGRKRIEILEVIRILGPFPNVRNTLKGDTVVDKPGGKGAGGQGLATSKLKVTYDSMIDGTGKEIKAPGNSPDGVRRVELDVLYADVDAVVCAVPWQGWRKARGKESDDGTDANDDPFEGDGSRILLFLKEEELKTKLDMLRVS